MPFMYIMTHRVLISEKAFHALKAEALVRSKSTLDTLNEMVLNNISHEGQAVLDVISGKKTDIVPKQDEKKCTSCGQVKPLSEFPEDQKMCWTCYNKAAVDKKRDKKKLVATS